VYLNQIILALESGAIVLVGLWLGSLALGLVAWCRFGASIQLVCL